MTKYLISFPGPAMEVAPEDFPAVGDAAHAVIRDAKAAGVYVFGGGIDDVTTGPDDARVDAVGCSLAHVGHATQQPERSTCSGHFVQN